MAITHPLAVGTRVQVLVTNFDDDEGSRRNAPAGEFGTILDRDFHDNGDGWAYTIVQEPSGVQGIWFPFDFDRGEIIVATAVS